jgi:hypothetical protein
MRHAIVIENIEEMRTRAGIDDVELREAIRGLQVGDFVRLTLLTGTMRPVGETVTVRITRILGDDFEGRLGERPASAGLSKLRCGSLVTFTRHHIHSLAEGRPTRER